MKQVVKHISVGEFIIDQEEKRLVNQVLDSGRISEGKMTQKFEQLFREYVGAKYCVAVNSGTSALIAGFLALLQDQRYKKTVKGAKVITTPLTYVADANAILMAGLEPVFVDVDPGKFSINPELIEQKVKELGKDNVAIVLPVHLMGYMCDMDKINSMAAKNDLVVFEDAAQAHGSLY
ncbi:MAG: DegT/DnrJ/EryC1/StrS family aminotransferase, partial [Candidatus Margulisbacteria bacterium]|nr:DegT/DnrJ/EryC1/StrS family aminotransferase [Candidatus Margulisiibacteriota bacterium]